MRFHVALVVVLLLAGCFPTQAPERVKIYTSVDEAMQEAADVKRVDLFRKGLKEIPEGLFGLPNLQTLSVRENPIGELPEAVNRATSLESLDASRCGLSALPSLDALTKLKIVYLSGNKLSVFPDSFNGMDGLVYLNLDRNAITNVSASVGNLKALRWLRLNANAISALAPEIGNMKTLERLYLDGNKLTQLPETMSGLENLTDLSLNRNQLTELPDWVLDLPSLQRLDLAQNKLTKLPANMGRMSSLQWLRLDTNSGLSEEEKDRIRSELPKSCQIFF